MSNDWVSLPEAIAFLAERVPEGEAIPLLLSLADDARIGSRVALIVDESVGQPRRNVPMTPSDWRDLQTLETNWLGTGDVYWRDGYTWYRIEIHRGDLEVNLALLNHAAPVTSHDNKQPRGKPGPKPKQQWLDAVETVSRECAERGYRKPTQRGDKAMIIRKLLKFVSERGLEDASESSAANYADKVIANLPDRPSE